MKKKLKKVRRKVKEDSKLLGKDLVKSKTLLEAMNLSQDYTDSVLQDAPCKNEFRRRDKRKKRKINRGNEVKKIIVIFRNFSEKLARQFLNIINTFWSLLIKILENTEKELILTTVKKLKNYFRRKKKRRFSQIHFGISSH